MTSQGIDRAIELLKEIRDTPEGVLLKLKKEPVIRFGNTFFIPEGSPLHNLSKEDFMKEMNRMGQKIQEDMASSPLL